MIIHLIYSLCVSGIVVMALIGLFALLMCLGLLIRKTGSIFGLARRVICCPLQMYLIFMTVILTFVASMVTITNLESHTGDIFKNFSELAAGLKSHKYKPIVTYRNTKRILFEDPESSDLFKAFNESALVCIWKLCSLFIDT